MKLARILFYHLDFICFLLTGIIFFNIAFEIHAGDAAYDGLESDPCGPRSNTQCEVLQGEEVQRYWDELSATRIPPPRGETPRTPSSVCGSTALPEPLKARPLDRYDCHPLLAWAAEHTTGHDSWLCRDTGISATRRPDPAPLPRDSVCGSKPLPEAQPFRLVTYTCEALPEENIPEESPSTQAWLCQETACSSTRSTRTENAPNSLGVRRYNSLPTGSTDFDEKGWQAAFLQEGEEEITSESGSCRPQSCEPKPLQAIRSASLPTGNPFSEMAFAEAMRERALEPTEGASSQSLNNKKNKNADEQQALESMQGAFKVGKGIFEQGRRELRHQFPNGSKIDYYKPGKAPLPGSVILVLPQEPKGSATGKQNTFKRREFGRQIDFRDGLKDRGPPSAKRGKPDRTKRFE